MTWSRWLDFGIALWYNTFDNSVKNNLDFFNRKYVATDKSNKKAYISIDTKTEEVDVGFPKGHKVQYGFNPESVKGHYEGNKYGFDFEKDSKRKETETKIRNSNFGMGFVFDKTPKQNVSGTLDYIVNLLLGIKEVYVESNTGVKIPLYAR